MGWIQIDESDSVGEPAYTDEDNDVDGSNGRAVRLLLAFPRKRREVGSRDGCLCGEKLGAVYETDNCWPTEFTKHNYQHSIIPQSTGQDPLASLPSVYRAHTNTNFIIDLATASAILKVQD